jgi:hypothetical protein
LLKLRRYGTNKEFASTSKLSILNAGKGEYEALILDLLGID